MIELLQPLVDAIARVLPALVKKKERDASAELGAELFLVYVRSNEALVLAEKILRNIEYYVEAMAAKDKYALDAGQGVSDDIRLQLRNLQAVAARVERWQWELQVLDGKATNDLRFLLDRKMSALTSLAGAIEDQRLPLLPAGVFVDDQGVLRPPDDLPPYSAASRFEWFHRFNQELAAHSVPTDRQWGPPVLAAVQAYLAGRDPRRQLELIRDSLEQIRAALETHFTVSDILLRVGDPRATT